ncbi:MAG TPA: histidinol-phosphatase HisJ family protein [Spirochaetota bacterium]|nr:histidinol-phosphatase HisJ family protein [Spirochaetota bacterium]HPL16615.1 histidinol-phosphatase HisJ family protein [Spirochaetota bacterium]HQJ72171.1 histidinol-phosphatase HisJ family protein [Spirochaetota bacterium]HRS78561.1 histidinol-phosphatase HisJ family protein [Spirochaetota bacterium]HRT76544.1 histidinol-phosphatase HisJ family protein [Spirochaetota bacterium]
MVDYHTHTARCGHAYGTVEEYIESALSRKIREIGFSDHAPMPEAEREGYTMSAAEVEPYIASLEKHRRRYKERISVRIGFEVDYPLLGSFADSYFTDPRIDYLIGSCHFIDGWAFDHPDFIDEYGKRDIDDIYGRYFSIMEAMAAARLFDVIGHFELVKKFGFRAVRDHRPAIEKIARLLAAAGTAVEVNTAGMAHEAREMYPADGILKILFDCNVPVTLGSDAHRPEQVGRFFPEAAEKLAGAGYRAISGFSKRKRYDITL